MKSRVPHVLICEMISTHFSTQKSIQRIGSIGNHAMNKPLLEDRGKDIWKKSAETKHIKLASFLQVLVPLPEKRLEIFGFQGVFLVFCFMEGRLSVSSDFKNLQTFRKNH